MRSAELSVYIYQTIQRYSPEDRALQRKAYSKFHKEIKALRISPRDASISNALGADEEVWQPVTEACANAIHISSSLLSQFCLFCSL